MLADLPFCLELYRPLAILFAGDLLSYHRNHTDNRQSSLPGVHQSEACHIPPVAGFFIFAGPVAITHGPEDDDRFSIRMEKSIFLVSALLYVMAPTTAKATNSQEQEALTIRVCDRVITEYVNEINLHKFSES